MAETADRKQLSIHNIDDFAVKASKTDEAFETLLTQFKPFLRERAWRFAGRSHDLHDEMLSLAMIAFYEAVCVYDQTKGHFLGFMNRVIHMRLLDGVRRLYAKQVETVPLADYSPEGDTADKYDSKLIAEASMHVYKDSVRRDEMAVEIESFTNELAEWGFSMDQLVKQSPKHEKLRLVINKVISDISASDEIMNIIWIKRYLPVIKIARLSGVSKATLGRSRIYILASLIIRAGFYDHMKEYIGS